MVTLGVCYVVVSDVDVGLVFLVCFAFLFWYMLEFLLILVLVGFFGFRCILGFSVRCLVPVSAFSGWVCFVISGCYFWCGLVFWCFDSGVFGLV